jgi:D-glycero-alpha-D-manno-heptose-7-phosphate kinase
MQSLEKNVAYYDRLLEIAHEAKNVFSSNSNKILFETGRLLNETWHVKKKLDKSVSNSTVDNLYEFGIKNGAVAGKLLGAGSGGFFLFLSKSFQEKRKLINSFKRNMHVDFKFEDLGTRIILNKKDYYDV